MSTEANGTPQIPSAAEPAEAQAAAEPAVEEISEQQQIRRDKRERILADGREAYPVTVPVTHTIQQVREKYGDVEAGQMTGDVAAVAGRVLFIRNTGKLCFASLRAGDGTAVQAMLSLDRVGAAGLEQWKHDADLGDHVWVRGEVGASRRGELSIFADEWGFAAKSLRPLPVAHKEMSEEARVRQRYVDLIMREEARVIARDRITALASLRASLGDRGFLEVETPILQTLQGGATARPFVTHMNAYDIELFLRIAPELFLKRCVVGGIERVYEINRNFRNEGADSTHSPEFGMLEYYQAYGDYNDAARTTRELIQEAAQAVCGTLQVTHADGSIHDLSGEWTSISLYGAVSEAVGEAVTPQTPRSDLERLCAAAGLDVNPNWLDGRLVEELLEHYVTPGFTGPTFVFDYPVDTSPLVRDHREIPGLVEKWDLYVDGFELATGYSELVDPIIQRQRLEEQAARAAIDEESMPLDEDFLAALEHGMPPSAGVGMGIDRLLMALTGLGIRETILFPLVKPLTLPAEKAKAAPGEGAAVPDTGEESVAAPGEEPL